MSKAMMLAILIGCGSGEATVGIVPCELFGLPLDGPPCANLGDGAYRCRVDSFGRFDSIPMGDAALACVEVADAASQACTVRMQCEVIQ